MLRAIGADEDLAHSSIRFMKAFTDFVYPLLVVTCIDVVFTIFDGMLPRFGIGRFTTEEEVDYTIKHCVASVRKLREMR